MGTGVMGLPFALSTLGWVLGLSASFAFAVIAVYCGVLLSRVRKNFYPDVLSYGELAERTLGRYFGWFTTIAIMINWTLLLPYYLMAAATALVISFYDLNFCYYEWAAILVVILIPFLQIRTLHGMRHLALLSDVSIIVSLFLIVGSLLYDNINGSVDDTDIGPPKQSFLSGYGSISSFIFAYQGQSMFLEIMYEMRRPQRFGISVSVANSIMFFAYSATAAVAYYVEGDGVSSFLPGSLKKGVIRTIVGELLTFHVIVAYLLTGQPLCDKIHRWLYPLATGTKFPDPYYDKIEFFSMTNLKGRLLWLFITVFFLLFAYLVANVVPFFADFQNIIGAGMGAPVMFGWPALFYLVAMRKHGQKIAILDLLVCCFFLAILTPFAMGVGLTSAFKSLVNDWAEFGLPFTCHLVGYS
eukprot:CAMPEP_0174267232 /NCGR_PEP_ID=MMETSP0439-20130205/32927_1 /TAXON_ID=0 /ORGANISM="Stereomyxa ramosa, Strain Chinc5" /LENGTH=412 /DNA_ID=CAMNT_0015354619 /DNA_START=233 /DNA_END=1471 /DNA_ORIENTATION=+